MPANINNLSEQEIDNIIQKGAESSLFRCEIICPIDEKHTITETGRLKCHVGDCYRRNAHLGNMVQCPFNKLHFAARSLATEHSDSCPDRPSQGIATIDTKDLERKRAIVHMVKMKLQCGLSISDEDRKIFQEYGNTIEERLNAAKKGADHFNVGN